MRARRMVRRLEWREGHLGRNGAGVLREEMGVLRVRVPGAPAIVPRAGPELLVCSKRVDQISVMVCPTACALPSVGVDAVVAVKVDQGVLPVAGLEEPEELDGEVPRPDGAQPGVGCLPEVGHGGVDVHAVKAVCTQKEL